MNLFWLVWNESDYKGVGALSNYYSTELKLPTRKHSSEAEAITEGKRLAKKHPGEIFHIMELVDSCKSEVVWASQLPEETPF